MKKILPGLESITLRQMAMGSGLSVQYCSRIRSGQNVPHPIHWKRFAELVGMPSEE